MASKAKQYFMLAKALTEHYFSNLPNSSQNRNIILAVILGGGGFLAYQRILRRQIKNTESHARKGLITTTNTVKQKVAVNGLFLRRLREILGIIIPSWRSMEFLHLVILTGLLLLRTLLSLKVADITGQNAKYLVERQWASTVRGIVLFTLIGIPASCVNSGLKYETNILSLRFRRRLSEKVNKEYLTGVNFYKASHLGGDNRIDNADQRVTADIEKFCDNVSNLYTTIFKPVLDVVLFTHKLSSLVGKRGPLILFAYYGLAAFAKRYMMPSFGKLTARESELEGDYRMAHQRLITNAEEIAFYDGSKKERTIINSLFNEIFHHTGYVLRLKALVGIFDNFLVKYGTSITGYIILALPIYYPKRTNNNTISDLTNDYVRNRQLLINLAEGVAQLVVLSNKVNILAGLTARVSELLEMVRTLDKMGTKPFIIKSEEEKMEQQSIITNWEFAQQWLVEWRNRGQKQREEREPPHSSPVVLHKEGGQMIVGKFIRFENVSIVSPDGKLLVDNLTFEVKLGQNVMVTGPNGSGKSSLFRILGELWPLQNGTVVKPRKEDILFIPQKPYLVLGTLRDQIIYPHSIEDMKNRQITDQDLTHLLSIVDPTNAILSQWKWDDVKDWFHAFSGGQKQRVAMARLFYHRPLFAILDECTSAVSDEVEGKIYETCKQLSITLFTVSHRPNLKKYHDYILRFDGRGEWEWSEVEDNNLKTI